MPVVPTLKFVDYCDFGKPRGCVRRGFDRPGVIEVAIFSRLETFCNRSTASPWGFSRRLRVSRFCPRSPCKAPHSGRFDQRVRMLQALERAVAGQGYVADRLLQHVADAAQVIKELVRVTAAGGQIISADTDWCTLSIDMSDYELERRFVKALFKVIKNGCARRQLRRLRSCPE